MPEQDFKYLDVPELIAMVKTLAKARPTGSTQELRNNHTGFLVRTGPLSIPEINRTIMEVRYEIYQRGVAGDTTSAGLEPKDPRLEKVMHVEVNRGYGHHWQGSLPSYLC